jgi:chemotaxis protein MotB
MRMADLSVEQDKESMISFYISFSDLMVMLGVFFLMLLSISKIEVGSFEKVKTSFSGDTAGTLVELSDSIKAIVEGAPGVPGVTVDLAEDGVRLVLDTGALFSSRSANLKPKALDSLEPILSTILSTSYSIDVEGHTDDVPLFRYYRLDKERVLETNWSLSGRRASSVIHSLIEFGFSENRLRLVGYASTRPLAPVEGKNGQPLLSARSVNRRVSLLIK